MAISGKHKLGIDYSDDNSEYLAVFHHRVLSLIVAGYKRLLEDNMDYTNEEEPNITGEIAKYAEEYAGDPASPEWAKHFVVYDEGMENTKGRKGKKRKKVDIVCVLTDRRPHSSMKFEAKRLKGKDFPVGKYVGRVGLGEFLAEDYAPELDTVVMLGYVQSNNCDYWAEQIRIALNNREKEVHLSKGGGWQKAGFEDINHCYKTRHDRPTIESELLVFHLLLDFTN